MPKTNQKYHSYCCIISNQLDLTFQKKEVKNSSQINTFLIKLATDLLQETKAKTGLCPLCNNFLTNLKDFSQNWKKVAQAKSLLTHQDLVEEMINRIEKGAMPATEQFWLDLLYLYNKRDGEVCFGDERQGFKGFAIPDEYFHPRNRKQALSKLKEIEERIEQRTPI